MPLRSFRNYKLKGMECVVLQVYCFIRLLGEKVFFSWMNRKHFYTLPKLSYLAECW